MHLKQVTNRNFAESGDWIAFLIETQAVPQPSSEKMAMSLQEVLIDEMRDLYSAENQLLKADTEDAEADLRT